MFPRVFGSVGRAIDSLRRRTDTRTRCGISPPVGLRGGVSNPSGLSWLRIPERWDCLPSFGHHQASSGVVARVVFLLSAGGWSRASGGVLHVGASIPLGSTAL